jgi:hypothetical protein
VPSKDLTWRLLGEDVTASKTFRDFASSVDEGANKADASVKKLDQTSKQAAEGGVSDLSDGLDGVAKAFANPMVAAIPAGIALVGPIAASGAAAMAAFGAAAGVSLLAFEGRKTQMHDNTAIGAAFTGQVKEASGAIATLEKSAATGADAGVFSALKQVNAFLPTLNPMVHTLAGELGTAASIGVGGLITGLKMSMPLFKDAGAYAEEIATKFANFTASPQFGTFVRYAESEFPKVLAAAESVGTALVEIGVEFHPVGDQLVQDLNGVGQAIQGLNHVGQDLAGFFSGGGPLGKLGVAPGQKGLLSFLNDTSFYKVLGDLAKGGKKPKSLDEQLGLDPGTTAAQVTSLQQLAGQYGVTADVIQKVQRAMQRSADSTAAQTIQFQLQNDAASLLQRSLGGLGTNVLGVEQANTALDVATGSVVTTMKANGRTLDDNTSKGQQNRQALQGQASAAIALAEQIGRQTGSTEKSTSSIQHSKQALLDQLAAQHLLTPEIQRYIDKLYAIPAQKKTSIDLQLDAARAALDGFSSELAAITAGTHYVTIQAQVGGVANASILRDITSHASGGFLTAGLSVVGEQGPELVSYTPGAPPAVFSNSQTRTVASGGGTNVTINIHAGLGASGQQLGHEIMSVLERYAGRELNLRYFPTKPSR